MPGVSFVSRVLASSMVNGLVPALSGQAEEKNSGLCSA